MFHIGSHFRMCALCAAMMLAAADALAQTSGNECAAGTESVTAHSTTACLPSAAAQAFRDCRDAGWTVMLTATSSVCSMPFRLYGATQNSGVSGSDCLIHGIMSTTACSDIFGTPPKFPKASDHTDVVVNDINTKRFQANCDLSGNAPGGYPPDHNLNGETECVCDRASYVDPWPNCTPFPTGLTSAEREGIRACTDQGWTISTATAYFKCDIPLTSGEGNSDGCVFGEGTPQCADVFGEQIILPEKEDSVRYVFSCGAGMSPAGANLNGATECVQNLLLRLRLFLEGPLR